MLHINENLYINFSSMLTFSVGNLFSRCVWFRFACFTIYIVHVWSKYRWEFSVMHFKIFFIERSFVEALWFGLGYVYNNEIHLTGPCCNFHDRANCSMLRSNKWNHLYSPFTAKVLQNSLFDTNINSSGSSTSLLFTAGHRDGGNQYPHLSNLHLCG